jgi:predicted PurR-regulated permease PerM
VDFAGKTTEGLAAGSADEHAGSEDGLSESAAFWRKRIGNHRLSRRGIGSLTNTNQGASDEQEHEGRNQAAGDGREAPEDDPPHDDASPAVAVGEKSQGNTGNCQDNEEPGLQGAKLRVRDAHLLAEKREKRDDDLTVGKVDKIDQSKYSKKTKLIGRERSGLFGHDGADPLFWDDPVRATLRDYITRMKSTTAPIVTTSDRLTTVLSYGAILLLGYLVFVIVEPFLEPLAWSAVLAIFFYPLHQRMARTLKPTLAGLTSTLLVTLLLILPAMVVLVYTAREAIDATARLQGSLSHPEQIVPTRLAEWIRRGLPETLRNTDFSEPLRQGAEKVASFLAGKLAALAKNLFTFFVDLFILLFALFFMFRDADSIVRGLRHLLPFDASIQKEMLGESRDLVIASVAVALLIAAIQGVMGGIAFALVSIPAPFFWGVLIAFFSLVPVVGSGLIWVPAALWLGFAGHWGKALLVVAICGGVTTVADNLVRPLLLRNRTRLNELLLFLSVLGGLAAFGLLGLVIGPTIVAAAMGVFRVYMQHQEELATQSA